MKHILLIATGGTIACCETENGLSPALTGADLLERIPALGALCRVTVCDLMQRDSTDLTADDRRTIAHTIWQEYQNYDGFVVAHGTDTLSYTAALLGHMLQNLQKPVILTGSMLPIGAAQSDAPRNLLDAFRVAAAGGAGVFAVMQGQIIHSAHVSKRHSMQHDAFVSVGAPPAGSVSEAGEVQLRCPPDGKAPRLIDALDPHVIVIKLIPDLAPSLFAALCGYPHVILESFGAGGIPARLEDAVRALIESGTRVYIASQCAEGGVDLDKYEVGRRARAMGAVSLGSRTTEDALAAIMCGEAL